MASEISTKVKMQLQRLQQLQDQLNLIVLRKQQWQLKLSEINTALEELSRIGDDEIVYRITGQVMIPLRKSEAVDRLSEEKELAEASIRTLEKQEKLVRREIETLGGELSKKLSPKGEKR